MSDYRVLIMDPMDAAPAQVTAAKDAIANGLTSAAPHIDVTCVLATEERERSFAEQGSWNAWCSHVATGVHYEQRTPLFNAIAIMSETMGKATASIMQQALEARRLGLLVHEGKLTQVVDVQTVDAEDWKSGWRAVLKP